MNLFVTIPALNERITIGQVVRGVPREIPGVARVEVVVVDDGSTDDTAAEAAAAGATVLTHPETRGVGAAFHTALSYVIERRGDLLVSIDADGQFNPADIPALAEPVIAGRADFSTASRFKDPHLVPEMPAVKLWGNRMMSRLVLRLTNGRYYDVSCGMRCYNRRAMLNLNLMGAFTYTQEVFLNLAFKRLRIEEVPTRVRGHREFGESRVASNILGYAVKTSRIIFRAYRDYKPMRFFGGMCLWLLVPAVLLEIGFFGHYLWTGHFTPYKFLGFGGGGLLILEPDRPAHGVDRRHAQPPPRLPGRAALPPARKRLARVVRGRHYAAAGAGRVDGGGGPPGPPACFGSSWCSVSGGYVFPRSGGRTTVAIAGPGCIPSSIDERTDVLVLLGIGLALLGIGRRSRNRKAPQKAAAPPAVLVGPVRVPAPSAEPAGPAAARPPCAG